MTTPSSRSSFLPCVQATSPDHPHGHTVCTVIFFCTLPRSNYAHKLAVLPTSPAVLSDSPSREFSSAVSHRIYSRCCSPSLSDNQPSATTLLSKQLEPNMHQEFTRAAHPSILDCITLRAQHSRTLGPTRPYVRTVFRRVPPRSSCHHTASHTSYTGTCPNTHTQNTTSAEAPSEEVPQR